MYSRKSVGPRMEPWETNAFEHVFRDGFTEAVTQRCSVKKFFLQISQNPQENTCTRVSFSIKLQASGCDFIKKEALAQVFSNEFWEISKNTFSQNPSGGCFCI